MVNLFGIIITKVVAYWNFKVCSSFLGFCLFVCLLFGFVVVVVVGFFVVYELALKYTMQPMASCFCYKMILC